MDDHEALWRLRSMHRRPPGQTWQDVIDRVLQSNLFCDVHRSRATACAIIGLFQDFLQQRLAEERPHEERDPAAASHGVFGAAAMGTRLCYG